MMNKTKLLSISVIALLLLNFGILGFLFLSKDKEGRTGKRMPREIVIEKLHFDENQIAEYDKTIKNHQKAIRSIDDSIRNTRNELYKLLNSEAIDTDKRDSLYSKFAGFQKQIETTHFNHFLEIKSICKKEQLADFKNLTDELSKIFNNRRKPKNE
jgi:periplasmic protein CpxP/Spy